MQLDSRAEVALLNRSIQIRGSDENFGCRVLLTSGSTVRLEGVEFTGCGQLSYTSPALLMMDVENPKVSNCSFLENRAQGIGAINTVGLKLEHNVIVNSIGSSFSLVNSTNARYGRDTISYISCHKWYELSMHSEQMYLVALSVLHAWYHMQSLPAIIPSTASCFHLLKLFSIERFYQHILGWYLYADS